MTSFERIVKFIDSGLPNYAIASYLNITENIVNRARVKIQLERDAAPSQVIGSLPRAQRVPVTRPFPVLTDDMPDGQRVVVLTRHGMAAPKIRRYLKSPLISDRQINRYATKRLGPARRGIANSREHWLSPLMIDLITQILVDKYSRNPNVCELCMDSVPEGCTLHHTKYEGATIFDLLFVCRSCNLARENKGLA